MDQTMLAAHHQQRIQLVGAYAGVASSTAAARNMLKEALLCERNLS